MSVLNLGPRTLGATLRGGALASWKQACGAFGIATPDMATCRKAFIFKRRKTGSAWGFDVWLWLDDHRLNLSACDVAPELRTIQDARLWAIKFARKHGFEPYELPRIRRPKPLPKLVLVPRSGGDGGTP